MKIDAKRRTLDARETRARGEIGCGLFFGLPAVLFGGLLLAVAFGPAEIRQDVGNPPVWLLALPGMLVTGLGVLMAGSGGRRRSRLRRLAGAKERYPGRPWLWDHAWNPRGARSAARRWAGKALAVLVLAVVFLTPFHWWAFAAGGPVLAKVVTIVLDLVPLLAIIGLGISVAGYLKYGDPRLQFAQFPFHLGEEINVRVDLPSRLPSGTVLRCTVRCIQERTETRVERVHEDGEWKNRRSTRTVCDQLWSATGDQTKNGSAPYAEIRFPLPREERLDTRLSENPPRYWELEIRGDAQGLDYFASFLLPVYA